MKLHVWICKVRRQYLLTRKPNEQQKPKSECIQSTIYKAYEIYEL